MREVWYFFKKDGFVSISTSKIEAEQMKKDSGVSPVKGNLTSEVKK